MKVPIGNWTIAVLAILAVLAFAAAAPTDAHAMAKETGARKCSDGIDNDGDGLTDGADPDCGGGDGGGGDPGFPAIFAVTVDGDYVAAPGPCNNADGSCDNQATIDEDKATTFNGHKRNPGTPYKVRAELYSLNSINVSGLVLTNVLGSGSCTDFFDARGGAGTSIVGDTVTWTGFMQASIWLDLTEDEGKYDRRLPDTGPTWTQIGVGRDVKGRITAPNLAWNLRFDDEWRSDSPSVYDSFAEKSQDGFITPTDYENDGINDAWTITLNGPVLAQSYSGDELAAMCKATLTWTVTRN